MARSTASRTLCLFFSLSALVSLSSSSANALELDWSGQFRAEYNIIHNYTLDSSDAGNSFDAARAAAGGYYIPSGGNNTSSFQTVFLRLQPKVIVNDNIFIKSEFWLGDPVYGIFGNAVPYSTDQRQFYSNQSRGSVITAQRFWGEFLSDVGTVQVGRAPLNWGLGIVWNSGDGLWDRYESTGDTIRLISKFGAFSFMPSFVMYSAGNNVGGASAFTPSTPPTAPGYTISNGDGGLREYTLALKYENLDDELEGGVNFIRRLGGAAQDPLGGYLGPQARPVSINFNIWDIYAKKRLGKFTLAAEAPITTGSLGTTTGQSLDYSTFAIAGEVDWKMSDSWELLAKGGHAPGQPNSSGPIPDNFRAFFFNPAYRLGLIMFNYQLASFYGPNTQNNPNVGAQYLRSPYDNPIVNANYLLVNPMFHTDKWTFDLKFIYAAADKTAANGSYFYNTLTRSVSPKAAVEDQGSTIGFETDVGATFQWDEYFQFRLAAGFMVPGSFWKFSNAVDTSGNPIENNTSTVFATSAQVGVSF
jgi:hypothetical protein